MTDQDHWATDGKCGNCEHYHRTDIQQGECWRYPPTPIAVTQPGGGVALGSARSVVPSNQTCGEWRANEFANKPGESKPIPVASRLIT